MTETWPEIRYTSYLSDNFGSLFSYTNVEKSLVLPHTVKVPEHPREHKVILFSASLEVDQIVKWVIRQELDWIFWDLNRRDQLVHPRVQPR